MYGYGISFNVAMKAASNIEHGYRFFMREYEPDTVNIGGMQGIPMLEALGTQFMQLPRATCGLPLDSSFHHLDSTYLQDDEYEEFIQDPTHAPLTKPYKLVTGTG